MPSCDELNNIYTSSSLYDSGVFLRRRKCIRELHFSQAAPRANKDTRRATIVSCRLSERVLLNRRTPLRRPSSWQFMGVQWAWTSCLEWWNRLWRSQLMVRTGYLIDDPTCRISWRDVNDLLSLYIKQVQVVYILQLECRDHQVYESPLSTEKLTLVS